MASSEANGGKEELVMQLDKHKDIDGLKERVLELAKRRGFLWPSYEIYGGVAGLWDYGPFGAMLKHRVE
ncbi:MAG: hypothetical protein ACXV3D_06835, partial [Halobacteriota archaeon]